MTNEFITDEQLDMVCGANQIPMIKEPPANKIPPRPKTNTTRELKVPLITIVPCPYIKDTYSEQISDCRLERLIPDIPIEIT
ncbi:MAG: hypothetical protein SR3Q1_00695 [Quinella sp. 3Q1]|nr:hypothetical protein [Quinella sp. 3Q1]MBR6887925.1 hypothetical protein [Selenomonadaceae bacterium]